LCIVCVRRVETRIKIEQTFNYLGNSLEVSDRFQLIDSMASGLTIGAPLGDWALAATTANSYAINNKPCEITRRYITPEAAKRRDLT